MTESLSASLKRLKLPGMADNLDLRIREAEENRLGYLDFFSLLVQDEVLNREANTLDKRLKAAGFSHECTFEDFDFEFNSAVLPPPLVRDIASCHFIERHKNLVLAGPPGIGKSHIAQAVGHEAARRGIDVLFAKTHKLLSRLQDIQHPRRAASLLKNAVSVPLLILDDFAFKTCSYDEVQLLYTIADERMNRRSTIVTSNRPPEDWFSVFPDPVIGGAILDRLVSSALKVFVTNGRSYRKEHALPPQFSSLFT
jgi:DNA replication protein DnaC